MATPVFASSVTYLMPIVAVIWGLLDGERFSVLQGLATSDFNWLLAKKELNK